ncbi:MAG: FHA domain-containing protein [Acidobacteriota bacterium]
MTDPEVTLLIDDESGARRHIKVDSSRFTIGRSPDNDLAIDDVSLSRRHAVLERFGDTVQISDCGSTSGTFVNDHRVSVATLKDGDSISAGHCAFTVQIINGRAPSIAKKETGASPSKENFLSTPVIAVMATVMLLVVMLIMAALSGKKENPPVRQLANESAVEDDSDTRIAPTEETNAKAGAISIEQIERAASQTLRRVSSDDRPYVFPSNAAFAIEDIQRQIERYRNSSGLAAALSQLAGRGGEIATLARREGIEPDLVIYTALAETDGHEDAAGTARRILPELLSLRATFGTELADKSLILVAAYRMGGGTKKSHPLLATMRRVVKDPLAERTVWHLRERNALSDDVYGFVVKFLALGIIAQNPRQFGVQAAPLAF